MKDNLKILMSNAGSSKYLAAIYFNHLNRILGTANLVGFCHSEMFYEYYNKSIFHKIAFRIYSKHIHSKISSELLKLVNDTKPDVLLIFKGMEILPSTLLEIKKKGVFLINYNLDHPFEYFSKGSGNKNVLNSINVYDLHITYSSYIKNQLNGKYPKVKAEVLPFAFNDEYKIEPNTINNVDEINKICFIGNPDNERVELIDLIAKRDNEVVVYGHQWDSVNFVRKEKIEINPAVYGEEYIRKMQQYRIQLNIFRPHNKDSHNMRTFEAPSYGAIMLAPYTAEQASFFLPDSEVFYYDSIDSLYQQIDKILKLSREEANAIRKAAMIRSLKSKYSYKDRAEQLFKIIKNNYA